MRQSVLASLFLFVSGSMGCVGNPTPADLSGPEPSPFGWGKPAKANSGDIAYATFANRPETARKEVERVPQPRTQAALAGVTQAPPESPRLEPPRAMDCSSHFTLEVRDLSLSMKQFLAKVEALGGHVERHENNSVTCRVPPGRFQELNAEIAGMGRVLEKSIKATDLTSLHDDLRKRFEEIDGYRARLGAVMEKTEKSDRLEDVLRIAEFRRITEEDEKLREELRQLEEKTRTATVNVAWQAQRASQTDRPANRFDWINEVGAEKLRTGF